MSIEEKINQINKQIQELISKKDELINQLKSSNLGNYEWENICEELDNDYYSITEDEFLYTNIDSNTETQKIFTRFLVSPKKYLVIEDFFQIPYEYETFHGTRKAFVYASLVLIKYWKKLTRKKTTTTISELKKFAQKPFSCLKNQNDCLKRLYYEIEEVQTEIDSCLSIECEHPETIYEFKNPISIHAQSEGMTYGKTREFIISGIIVKNIELP